MTKLSPAFTEGTRPREPTRAAAASLDRIIRRVRIMIGRGYVREDVAVEVGCYHHVEFSWVTEEPEEVVVGSSGYKRERQQTYLYTALSTSCSRTLTLSYLPSAFKGTARTVSRKRPSVTDNTFDLWMMCSCWTDESQHTKDGYVEWPEAQTMAECKCGVEDQREVPWQDAEARVRKPFYRCGTMPAR